MSSILIAEDDANLRETLAEALRFQGYTVLTAPNGQAAVEMFEAAKNAGDPPRAVVLDMLLPKLNGFDTAAALRQRGCDAGIIFISGAFKSPQNQADARDKFQARGYLLKPFDISQLKNALKPFCPPPVAAQAAAPTTSAALSAATPLPPDGNLLEAPVLYLLWRAHHEQHSGILELFGTTPGERARIFLYRGRAALAQHSDAQLNLGVALVRDGVLDAQLFKQVCDLAVDRSVGLYDVVRAEGYADDNQIKAAYKRIIPQVLERTVAMQGKFRFHPGEGFVNVVPAQSVPLLEPLLAGLRQVKEAELEPHVGPRRPLRLAPGDAWAEVTPMLAVGCGSDSLVRAINGRATIAQLLEAATTTGERSSRYRQVYLLMSTMSVKASLEPIRIEQAPAAEVHLESPPASPAATFQAPRTPAPSPQPFQASGPPRTSTQNSVQGVGARTTTQTGAQGVGGGSGFQAGGGQGPHLSKPFIDESLDRGVAFTPDEQAARNKIAEKFEFIDGRDYFFILGVEPKADAAAVKRAYIQLARDFHTDTFAGLNLGTAQKKLDHVFSTIQTAYTTLTDPNRRGEYEAGLSFKQSGASTDVAALLAADAEFQKAKLLVDRGELVSALKLIERVLAVTPKNEELLGYRAYCTWWQHRDSARAELVIHELENHYRALPAAHSLKEFVGWIRMECGDLKQARNTFRRVLEAEPNHPGATRGMRAVQRKMEEADKKAPTGLGKFLKR